MGYSLKELLCVLVEVVGVILGVGVEVILLAEVPVAAVSTVVTAPAVKSAAFVSASAVEATVPAVTVATVVSAIPAVKAVPAVSATVIATVAWTALRLHIAFRLRGEGAHGESHLAGLRIYLQELHVDLLTDGEDILYIIGLVLSDL